MFSNTDIEAAIADGRIICDPFVPENLSVASIDLRLGATLIRETPDQAHGPALISFKLDKNGRIEEVCRSNVKREIFDLKELGTFVLQSNDFVLGETLEICGSNSLEIDCILADKSTPARCGLSTHFSAGYIDAANALRITLELRNNGHIPIELQYGMHICQVRFEQLLSPASHGYSGKYSHSAGVEAAK